MDQVLPNTSNCRKNPWAQRAALVGLAVSALIISLESSFARPLACNRLEEEFIDLSARVSLDPVADSYQSAIYDQQDAIAQVEAERQANRCGSFDANMAVCEGYGATLAQMRNNLSILKNQLQELVSREPMAKRLFDVKQSLVELKCSQRSAATPPAGAQPVAVVPGQPVPLTNQSWQASSDQVGATSSANITSGNLRPLDGAVSVPLPGQTLAPAQSGGQAKAGGYRTMCVRRCDGLYFPVNDSASPADFAEDQNLCASMCPAAQTELYVYRNGSESEQDMRSLTGVPYGNHPQAYRFQTGDAPSCSCEGNGQPALQASTIDPAGAQAALQSGNLRGSTTLPSAHSEQQTGQQAGAFADTTGSIIVSDGLSAREFQALKNPAPQKPRWVEPKTGPIRKVGPKYFDDQ
ncbi:DUF2865 domain-containing protein [Polycladidibacter hongkongensis]|uniref:DUF2865 domain-containing protein n=1 Tax=Polycladidibacter hongkongensis TaxID=1647556 RepID=UPI000B139122|nr:DUF2865 domain-containing protein [Pseudovibrio hongkongensis]